MKQRICEDVLLIATLPRIEQPRNVREKKTAGFGGGYRGKNQCRVETVGLTSPLPLWYDACYDRGVPFYGFFVFLKDGVL